MYGNGGMNTDYPAGSLGPVSVGIDLSQMFISATYAGTSGNLSWGVAPTLAIQTFKGDGLGGFGVTGVDRDWSYGGGLRAGITYKASPTLTLGLSGQTKMYMSKFDEWATLFENAGSLDIPASITAGVAWQAQPNLMLMMDVQRIFYSGVPAISNAGGPPPFGGVGGPGFGWDNIYVLKLGLEWKANDQMTWRAGYAYSENPVGTEDVFFGTLAPGIVTHHLTAGGTYAFSDSNSIDFAVEYAPENRVAGVTPAGAGEIFMKQLSVSVGWTHNF
jgi:long-chain fatty acid transport protein